MVFSNAAAKIDINHQDLLSILILEDLVISLLMLSNLDPETMSFVWWCSPRNGKWVSKPRLIGAQFVLFVEASDISWNHDEFCT